MSDRFDETRYKLIKLIEENPCITQREIAGQLGISLGKVNYCLKALIDNGWVKIDRFARPSSRSGYSYMLTPLGVKKRVRVVLDFLEYKQDEYEKIGNEIELLKKELSKLDR